MTKKPKLISSIRAKLVSAVAMLLVAMIMVVSSTYAWFTLSTAPEVTGISTQIGANGALEMALLPSDGLSEIKSAVGDGELPDSKKNLTWGNLINLKDAYYGLDKITLYPSRLNLDDGYLAVSPLGIPEYGSDGRVSAINTGKTVTGVLNQEKGNFYENDQFGVRGVGAASGMTDRQLNYRNAAAAGGSWTGKAKTGASTALNTNGSALANIAIEHGMGGTESYDETDVKALRALVNGTKDAVASIEKAYMYYIAAYAASAAGQSATVNDVQAKAIYDTVATADTLFGDSGFLAILEENGVSTLPEALTEAIDKLETTKGSVDAAETELAKLEQALAADPDATFVWAGGTVTTYKTDASGNYVAEDDSVLYYKVGEEYYAADDCEVSDGVATPKTDATAKTEADMTDRVVASSTTKLGISGAMMPLANTQKMLVNGYKVSEVKANLGNIVSSVSNGGLKVVMETGAGVFADIADHCGDYSASVTIEKVEYGSIVLNNMNARMETKTTVGTSYLPAIDTSFDTIAGAPTGTGTVMPISDFYGYIIDMAFRTNAPDSNLLLQTQGTDRIYDGNNNEDTMGHGSTMTFSTLDNSFDNNQIKELMSNLRVVFFEPNIDGGADKGLGTVLVYAKLDVSKSTISAGENGETFIEAPLYLYKEVTTTTTTYKTDASGNYYSASEADKVAYYNIDGVYYAAADCTKAEDGTVTANSGATAVAEDAMTDRATVTTTETSETILTGEEGKEAVITAMPQNATVAVSVLVYLDGENLGNDDVSATVAQSLTGTMNLQFASSAPLDPMDYSDLYTPGEAVEQPEGGDQTP